jgi:hypothetical protein
MRRALGNRAVSESGPGGQGPLALSPDLVRSADARPGPGADELQARAAAARIARGEPAGLPGVPAHRAASAAGTALPQPMRGLLEHSLGTDLSTVRLHADPASAAAVRHANAHAITVGEDIAVAPEHYLPQMPAARTLIAHEVAHVVQQRVSGVRPQFATTSEAAAPEEPIWVSASLEGLRVTSPGRRMPAGQESVVAYLTVVLRRIAPTATPDQVRILVSRLSDDPTIEMYGPLARGRDVPQGEDFAPTTIHPLAFAEVASILDDLHIPIVLDPQQRQVLQLGIAADQWAAAAVAELQQDYPWYSEAIWRAQLSMHTQVLADAVVAEEATPGAPGGRQGLIERLRPPLDVLEATRLDPGALHLPAGTTEQQKRDQVGQGAMWKLLWGELAGPTHVSQEQVRIRAIQFYWTAPGRYDTATHDSAARLDFLRRLWHWFERTLPALDQKRDYTQELLKDPGRFTDQPFPARLEAIPAPVGDLRIVPAHTEHRYRFAVDFSSLFDAFGSYAYRWDVLEWRPGDGDTAQAIRAIEGGQTDADTRRTGRRAT